MRYDSNFSEITGSGGGEAIGLPTFHMFLWPVIEVMKSRVGEWSRAQVVDGVIEHSSVMGYTVNLSDKDKSELRYRAARAFDLLVVADVVEERFGNLYVLGNGALVLTEEEALAIPKRIRTLDSYLHQSEDGRAQDSIVDKETKQSIARKTVRFLRDESLNELQLKEKLVKDFVKRRGLGKNLRAINAYLKKAEYVKMVLESEDVVSCRDDGTIELTEDLDQARQTVEEHYDLKGWAYIVSRFRSYFFCVRDGARRRIGSRVVKRFLFDVFAVLSVVGLSWLLVKRIGPGSK